MFQTFDEKADPSVGPARIALLREELARRGLDGFIVPHDDEYQNEYIPPHAERLAWLTGFTGSAGWAVVTAERGAIFVDSRYTLQADQQVDLATFALQHLPQETPATWLRDNVVKGQKIGYDPRLHTIDGARALARACATIGAELVPVADNPIDAVWHDQPDRPRAEVVPHPLDRAGEPHDDKIRRIAEAVMNADADVALITTPDSIAWLFNIRGGDVAHTPIPLARALLHADGHADLFIDERKLTEDTWAHLGNRVTVRPEDSLDRALEELGRAGATVKIDAGSTPAYYHALLEKSGAEIVTAPNPVTLPKARKNPVEVGGARAAHERDGVALTRFLHWLKREAPEGRIDEIDAVKQLETFRRETGALKDISFDTISGTGPNGAIVHYRVTDKTSRHLTKGDLYLVDSGAQYVDGTTDVTRTLAIGTPDPLAKDRFTRVLRGHIAMATARFPQGTTGAQIDALVRQPLWAAGIDFGHGTGHGVGSYLGVHEGPQAIAPRGERANVPLEPGMIISNEPGYYKTGAFGIRIENLVVVTEPQEIDGGDMAMLGFETLTLAPIDLDLVDPALMTAPERDWLNAYHARVRATIGAHLDDAARAWLDEVTRPV